MVGDQPPDVRLARVTAPRTPHLVSQLLEVCGVDGAHTLRQSRVSVPAHRQPQPRPRLPERRPQLPDVLRLDLRHPAHRLRVYREVVGRQPRTLPEPVDRHAQVRQVLYLDGVAAPQRVGAGEGGR